MDLRGGQQESHCSPAFSFTVPLCPAGWPPSPSPQIHDWEKASRIMLAPLSGTGKALELSATPAKVRQLRKLQTRPGSRVPVPSTWAETSLPCCWEKSLGHCSDPGHVRPHPAQLLCPALPVISSDFAPSYRWSPSHFEAAGSSHRLAWWQGCLAADCGLPGGFKAHLNPLP